MANFPETNHSLVARVQDLGDGASWIEFIGIYQPVVFRMAKRRGLQDADAHDVMQQVFVSIAGAIHRWKADEDKPPFRAWLTTITKNAIAKSLSRRPRDQAAGSTSVFEQLHALPADLDVSETEILIETRREMFRWAAQKVRGDFSRSTWDAFWRTSVMGEPIAAVAQSTNQKAGTIYVARHRVIARLKEEVEGISQQWDLGTGEFCESH